MKKQHLTLLGFGIVGLLAISSCNNTDNSAKSIADSAIAKTDTAMQDIKQGVDKMADKANSMMNENVDSNFVVKAATTNSAELRILQAGLDKCTDKELKGHLRMMLADHKKLGAGVKTYAAKKSYSLPDGDNGKADDELAKLNGLDKGAGFDKEMVDHLVSAHQDCIDMFEKGQNKVKDDELKKMIGDALPTLHSHLDMMKQMQDKMGK